VVSSLACGGEGALRGAVGVVALELEGVPPAEVLAVAGGDVGEVGSEVAGAAGAVSPVGRGPKPGGTGSSS